MDDNFSIPSHYEFDVMGSELNLNSLSYNTSNSSSLFIKPPVFPTISIDSLISMPNNDYPYNGFKIYCKEFRSRGINLIHMVMSRLWSQEQPNVRLEYVNIADNANRKYKEKWSHIPRHRYQQLPINQSLSPADTSKTIPTHSINNTSSSIPAIETNELYYELNTIYSSQEILRHRYQQLPINQSSSPADTLKTIPTHSINNSSSSIPEIETTELYYEMNTISSSQEIVNPLDICNQTGLVPPTENLNKRPTSRTNTSAACNHCKKSKIRCKNSGNSPCERCIKRRFECTFSPQKKRGPKNNRLNMTNCTDVQKLDKWHKDYERKVNKLGYCVQRTVIAPGTSNQDDALQILTLPIEESTAYTSVNCESGISNNSNNLSPHQF
ncbi:16207_t:CDS:1 [Gigaspora margarita]|uniref:16207_t:CDS:1 n=1 Tax=Gigaspora margarita TaxID=4874 RepID=A0ABN7UGD5_GIGMA|nr:16207_t:CDS:1 [Gigaspora margarita]